MTPSGQPLYAKTLRAELSRADRMLRETRGLDEVQRAGLRMVVQTITWALHDLDDGVPAMTPVDAAMLGPRPAGGIRRDVEGAVGPKRWRTGIIVG